MRPIQTVGLPPQLPYDLEALFQLKLTTGTMIMDCFYRSLSACGVDLLGVLEVSPGNFTI